MKARIFFFVAMLWFLAVAQVLAQLADASLSVKQAMVGQPVVLTLRVENAPGAKMPRNFAVDGLDIRFRSQSQQVNMVNFQSTMVVTYSFVVVPQRAGDFTIPSILIPTRGGTLKTNPVQLVVTDRISATPSVPQPLPAQGGYQAPAYRAQQAPKAKSGDIVSLQLILPKGKIYVGQMVPVEIRAYFDGRYQYQVDQLPVFSGEGYVVEKLSKPTEEQKIMDDVPYIILSFQTAITPVKQGKLEIQPATLTCAALVSQPLPDIFGDLFGNALSGQVGTFGDYRQVQGKSEPLIVDVLPLPKEGRPESFSGAIGKFSMTATAGPKKAEAGEPVTMKIQIRGQGNFQAMSTPELINKEGWRVYPASESFMAEDYTGFSGTKTFEISMIATKDQRITPGIAFSYFDPFERKYQTLTGSEIPVIAAGSSEESKTDDLAKADRESQRAKGANEKVEESQINNNKPQLITNLVLASTTPQPFRFDFLLANSFAFIGLLSFVIFCAVRAFYHSPKARELRLKRMQARLMTDLEQSDLSTNELYDKAAEFVRLEGMIRTGRSTDVTSRTILGELDAEIQKALLLILEKAEEMKYGADHHATQISGGERREIINLLRHITLQRTVRPAFAKTSSYAKDSVDKSIRGIHLFVILAVFVSLVPTHAGQADLDVWQTANDAFSENKWDAAARGYQLLIDKGLQSPALYYNFGLTEKQRGDIAGAALAFMRAHALAPSNVQISEQLLQLAKENQLVMPTSDWKHQVAKVVGLHRLWIAGVVIWWLGAFVLVFGVFLAKRKPLLIVLGLFIFLLGKTLLVIAWGADPLLSGRHLWIVTTKQPAKLKAMPVDNAEKVSELNPGSVVKVDSQRGNWVYCVLPNGVKGWLPIDAGVAVTEFLPPSNDGASQ